MVERVKVIIRNKEKVNRMKDLEEILTIKSNSHQHNNSSRTVRRKKNCDQKIFEKALNERDSDETKEYGF